MQKKIKWISGISLLAILTALVGAWQLRARDAMVNPSWHKHELQSFGPQLARLGLAR